MARRPVHSGFTLLEMLIAVTIIVLIMAMMYGSYATTTRSLQRYETQSACRRRADLILRLMTRQIRGAFAPLSVETQNPASLQAAPDPVFRGNGENPQGEFLTFLTTSGSSAGADAGPALVVTSYRYNAAEASLSIRQTPRTGGVAVSDTAPWTPLVDHVADLKVEFHDGAQWRSRWDDRQSQSPRLPRAVRISMTVSDEPRGSYQAQTTIPIICRTALQPGDPGVHQAAGKL